MTSTDPATRPEHLRWPPSANDSDADWALIGRSVLSYTTPFHINEDLPASEVHGQIMHGPIEIASAPYLVGTVLIRNYTAMRRDGEEYLMLQALSDNKDSKSDILWRRIA